MINQIRLLRSGKTNEKHEEFYRHYLIVKETPKRGLQVSFNEEEIQKHRKRYSGFFCILSNKIKTAKEALSIYRTKDVVENSFDELKNHLDMKRLRVRTAAAMDSRLFLQYSYISREFRLPYRSLRVEEIEKNRWCEQSSQNQGEYQ
ncbi:MAG: hypothetical protein K940chlam9_00001 [Chlamydiae bacterium]|nr:hypothetical protein [Chlamydiota bacterium]